MVWITVKQIRNIVSLIALPVPVDTVIQQSAKTQKLSAKAIRTSTNTYFKVVPQFN